MSTLQQIERAIETLTPQQVEELYLWLDQHHPQSFDARMTNDLAAGRLDNAIQLALDEEKAGQVQPL